MDSVIRIEGKAAEALINKIGDAVTGLAKPWQTLRIAKADAKALLIKKQAELEAKGLDYIYARSIAEEIKKQINMDQIVEKAIPQLSSDAKPEDIENDWLSYFFDRCRIISEEGVQEVWSRILAGEANKPGSFSRKTIDCLQSLDREDAKTFNNLRTFMFRMNSKLIACVIDPRNQIYHNLGGGFSALQQLEGIGLLSVSFAPVGGGPCVEKLLDSETDVEYFNYRIKITKKGESDLKVGFIRLTRSGRELAEICHAEPLPGFIEYIVDTWNKHSGVLAKIIK